LTQANLDSSIYTSSRERN